MLPKLAFSQNPENLNKLFTMLDTTKNDTMIANINQVIGIRYIGFNLDSAEYFMQEAIKQYDELEKFRNFVNTTIYLAIVYMHKSETDKAIKIIIEIMPRVIESEEKFLEGRCTFMLGDLNRSAEYFENAISYLIEAKNIFKEIDKQYFYGESCNRVAATYYEMKKYQLAIAYADSSLIIAEKFENEDFIVINLDIKAASYKDLEQYDRALLIYEKIIKLSEGEGISSNILRNIADVYFKLEDYNKCIEYGLQAYNRNPIKIYIENIANILSESYEKIKDYKNAYKYAIISKNTYHEIFNEEKNAQIAELNTKYETEKKENEIRHQKDEIINNKLELKQKKILNYSLGIGIFLTIIIFTITLFNRLKLKQLNNELSNKNNEIKLQNEEITQQSDNLLSANQKLEELDELKQGMTAMLVHDLKNPISTILNLSKNNDINSASRHMLNMVSNILDVQKYEEIEMVLDTKTYSLYMLVSQAVADIQLLAEHKNIKLQNNITTNTFIDTDEEITKRIFVNLLTNAIKYSYENGTVTIDSEKNIENSDFVKIRITDNGTGIEPAQLNSVFDKFTQVMAKKSGHARSTGLGLTFCKMAIEAHGGEIQVSSIPNKKTVFTITLPYSKEILDNEDELIINSESDNFKLNSEEKKYLSKFIDEYQKYEIYDIIPLRKITAEIDENFSENIKIWKDKMQKIVYNTNETEYEKMKS